jgi:hypothetical protein
MNNTDLYNNLLKLIALRDSIFHVPQLHIKNVLKKKFSEWIISAIKCGNFADFYIKNIDKFAESAYIDLEDQKWSHGLDLNIIDIPTKKKHFDFKYTQRGDHILATSLHNFKLNNNLYTSLSANHTGNTNVNEDIFLMLLFYTSLFGNTVPFVGLHTTFVQMISNNKEVYEIMSTPLNTTTKKYYSLLSFEQERFGGLGSSINLDGDQSNNIYIMNMLNSVYFDTGLLTHVIDKINTNKTITLIIIASTNDKLAKTIIDNGTNVKWYNKYSYKEFAFFDYGSNNHKYITDVFIISLNSLPS